MRGVEPGHVCVPGRSVDLWGVLGSFFALVAHFFAFLTHLKLSCIFVTIFGTLGTIFGGFGRVLEGILGRFSMIFGDFFENRDFVKIELPPRREHDF